MLKKLSQSTKPTQIKERTADLLYIKELYDNIKLLLPVLNLSYESLRYFANSVIKSDIFQLNQRTEEERYLHVVAFIAHQYYRLQDNLVDTLLTSVKYFENAIKRNHKDRCYEHCNTSQQYLKYLVHSIDENVFTFAGKIKNIIENNKATDSKKLNLIQELLNTYQATLPKIKQKWQDLKTGCDVDINVHYYDLMEEHSLRLQNRVSSIIKALEIQGESSAKNLINAIDYFKNTDGIIKNNVPIDFLDSLEYYAIIANQTFRQPLYKVLLFTYIAKFLKSGQLNLKHSYKYRPLDEYIIPRKRWKTEKEELLIRAGLTKFTDCNKVLQELDQKLIKQYQKTNSTIYQNKNPYFKSLSNKGFIVSTPKQEENAADSLKPYFPELHFVPLPEILSTVNSHTEFLQEFRHWQHTYTKNRVDDKILYAGIIGLGCAIGTPKMSRISKFINENSLQYAVNWYFSIENIRAANDCIVKVMDKMDLPNIYRRNYDILHTASDGQKFEVRVDSLNANYSFKYFGKGQGVTANTFIDERNLLWHSLVFSAAERESAYVIDGLMHNDVIKSDIHSTDTHGYSEAIFAVTYLLGFSYAPRIKNLKKQTLYIFKSSKHKRQSHWAVQPEKYINLSIIEEYWEDILRLIATIKLKETSASDIFRRLNSYSRQHSLYYALKSFGQIIKSDFLLRYINDAELRQTIEKQLSKIELANRFTRAIAIGNPREFTQGDKEEQEIAESCNRLIKNSIICWNYLYLSRKLEKITNLEQREKLLAAIASHSVISWAHIA